MPYTEVMHKWKKGELHSGSKKGPVVKGQKQAVAIMLSEKREASKGKEEYKSKKYQDGGPVSGGKDTNIPLPSLRKGETNEQTTPTNPVIPDAVMPKPAPKPRIKGVPGSYGTAAYAAKGGPVKK